MYPALLVHLHRYVSLTFLGVKYPETAVWNILDKQGEGFGLVFVIELDGLGVDLKILLLCFNNIFTNNDLQVHTFQQKIKF